MNEQTKTTLENFTNTAVDNGFVIPENVKDIEQDVGNLFLNVAFWEALGRAYMWGQWTKTLSEVEHDWELEYYMPDEEKTPVHGCRVCMARKINDVVEVDTSFEGEPTWEKVENASDPKDYKGPAVRVLKGHGAFKRDDWKTKMHFFFQMYLIKGLEEALGWLLKQTDLK